MDNKQQLLIPLTPEELIVLRENEDRIEQGLYSFVDAGEALREIREKELYKAEYKTFKEYCLDRWGFQDRQATFFIEASKTVGYIETRSIDRVLPERESHVRPLTRLQSDQQVEAWEKAVDTAPDGKITAGHVKKTADEMFPKEKKSGPKPKVDEPDLFQEIIQDQSVIKTLEYADKEAESGRGYTDDDWEEKPDNYVGHCYKQCYADRTMIKGSVLEYGVRGVYVCTGCGYAYPPMSEPSESVPYKHDPLPEDDPPERQDKMTVHYLSETPEHYTPQSIIDATLECFGGQIDLDPCSNDIGDPNVPAEHHYTADEDGLSYQWLGRVYMNPPYGREIKKWVDKLCSEHEAGRIDEAIALVPSRTDTKWFARLRDYPVCFVRGRLTFIGNEDPAPFPSAVFYLGNDIDKFFYSFQHLGDIWQKIEPGMFGE